MNVFRMLLRMIWRGLFFLNGAITLILLFPAFYFLLRKEAWFPYVFRLKRFWAKLLIGNVGIRCKVIKSPVLDPAKAYVICPNHSSFLDIVLMYRVFRQYFHFMGKAELKKVPLFNKFFDRMNILVDRQSIIGSHRAFKRAADDIEKGISIAIFPEATIPECSPQMSRFKNGAFKLAIEKQIPIVPVVFLDNWRLLPDTRGKWCKGGPGVSRVIVHDPVSTEGLTENDLNDLKNSVFEIIQKTLREHKCIP